MHSRGEKVLKTRSFSASREKSSSAENVCRTLNSNAKINETLLLDVTISKQIFHIDKNDHSDQ